MPRSGLRATRPTELEAALAITFLALAAAGCGAVRLPPRLSPEEARQVREERLPFTVGVELASQPNCSPTLVELLRETGVFRRVDYVQNFDTSPDLIARIERRCQQGGGWVPLLPILTLGIVPQWLNTGYGYAFTLRSPGSSDQVIFDCHTSEGTVLVGWAGTLLSVLPDWKAGGDPETSRRHYDRLAYALLSRRDQIERVRGSALPSSSSAKQRLRGLALGRGTPRRSD